MFVLSGACGLVYEVAWSRRLELSFGTSVHAIATILAVYMTGLGAGAWIAGRWADRWSPARCVARYAAIEALVAVCGLLSLPLCRAAELAFFALAPGPTGPISSALRVGLSFGVLLLPTILMGATLPLLTRALAGRRPEGAQRVVAVLYGANTLGAVAGAGVTGFVLLERVGLVGAVACGVMGNLAVAAVAWRWRHALVGAAAGAGAAADPEHDGPPAGAARSANPAEPHDAALTRAGLAATFGFGLAALALEVGWSRLLGLVFGSSSAGFTLTLVSVLLGIGAGSFLVRRPLTRSATLRRLVALALAVGLGSNLALVAWPHLSRALARGLDGGVSPGALLALQLAVGCGLLLPATLSFGAAFPLATRLGTAPEAVGRGVGAVYLSNTAGALLGAGPVSLIGLELLGLTSYLYTVSWAVTLGAGLLAAVGRLRGCLSDRGLAAAAAGVLAIGALGLAQPEWAVHAVDLGPVVQTRSSESALDLEARVRQSGFRLVFLRDGASATVSVREARYNRFLTINGKVDASTGKDMPTQVLLGALPFLVAPEAEAVLLIGLGSGISAATVAEFPSVRRLDVAELEPAVAEAAAAFDAWTGGLERHVARGVLDVQVADGRTVLATGDGAYDLVISQPTNPWVAGVASLFTREFYQLVRSRLAPGGVACQWIQLYLSDPWMARSQARTFAEAFPHVQVWFASPGDVLLLGSDEPLTLDLPGARVAFPQNALLRREGRRLNYREVDDLVARYVCGRGPLLRWAREGSILTDLHPRLEGAALRNLLARPTFRLTAELLDLRDVEAPLPPHRGRVDAARARTALAEVFCLSGPRRAIRELDAADRLGGESGRRRRLRARAVAALGQGEAARAFLARAGQEPLDTLLAAELAFAAGDAGGTRRALAQLEPREDAIYHYLSARVAATPEQAFSHAATALGRFDPQQHALAVETWAVAALCDLAPRLGREHEAEAVLRAHLRDYPHDWLYAAALAKLWLDTGRAAEAVPLFERVAQEVRPVTEWVRLSHAAALLRVGRPARARSILEDVLRLTASGDTYEQAKVLLARAAR